MSINRLPLIMLGAAFVLVLIALAYKGVVSERSARSAPSSLDQQLAALPSLPTFDARSYCAGIGGQLAGVNGKSDAEACLNDEELWLVTLKYRLAEGVISNDDLQACQAGLYGINRSYAVFAKCVQLRRPGHQSLSFSS